MSRRAPQLATLGLSALLLAACASTPTTDPRYEPTQNVLEVLAVLRQHVPDDTYRFEPARDFTGRNVYRSSLLRLENLERVHVEALKAGHMNGVIAFAKGRSFERLRAFDLAAEAYRLAAEREQSLAVEALRSADVNDQLHRAAGMAIDLDELGGNPHGVNLEPDRWKQVVAEFDARKQLQESLLRETAGTHQLAVVREEIERTDVSRARYLANLRHVLEDGDLIAISELQKVATEHSDSKNVNRHILALANLYAELANEYVEANPPESLRFDPAHFQELIDSASQLYELVAGRDGTTEKLEASRRLEAFLAFALRVDRDRFTP